MPPKDKVSNRLVVSGAIQLDGRARAIRVRGNNLKGVSPMKKILVVIAVPVLLGWAIDISWCNDYDWQNAQSFKEMADAQQRDSFNTQPVYVPIDWLCHKRTSNPCIKNGIK
jgi:hypothetical protein